LQERLEPTKEKHLSVVLFLGRLEVLPAYFTLYTRLERSARDKHPSLVGPFISYDDKKVLLQWPLGSEKLVGI
jgi:hypothetical protein